MSRLVPILAPLSALVFLAACGGPDGPPEYPDLSPPEGEEKADSSWDTGEDHPEEETPQKKSARRKGPVEEDSKGIPTQCSKTGGSICVPAGKWVRRLCADVHGDVALYMFQSGTPWQRMYLTRETDAVNASGGASVVGKLAFDEEVLILRHRGADEDSVQVGSGSGSYDALRWDGSCVSLEGEELTTRHPPKAKTSRIEWRWLGEDMQAALRKDSTINETFQARRKECKGVSMGAVSKKCQQLDEKLVAVTVDYVRNTSDLPLPKAQP